MAIGMPVVGAIWALGGLYLSWGPALARSITSPLLGGLALLCLYAPAALAIVLSRHLKDRTILMLGINALIGGAADGSAAQCAAAENIWPLVAATQQLAYRTLAACWQFERGQHDADGPGIPRPVPGAPRHGGRRTSRVPTPTPRIPSRFAGRGGAVPCTRCSCRGPGAGSVR